MICNVKGGIVYFPTEADAQAYRTIWTAGGHFAVYSKSSRVVEYNLGFAIQTRKSGDYFGPNGIPSMQERINQM